MPRHRKVDADVLTRPAKRVTRGRPISPEQLALVRRIRTITDETVVYEASLGPDEKPATLRQQPLRAAKLADMEIAGGGRRAASTSGS